MNISKAFVQEHGFYVDEKNGGPLLTGGVSSPVGLGLPYNCFYIQTFASSKHRIWQKVGAGDTASDWRILSAQDVPFDPSLQNFGVSIDTVQEALDLLKQGGGSGVSGTVVGGHLGNLTAGSFFSNASVAMNITPFDLSLKNILLRSVTFRNENAVTGTIDIEYYNTNTLAWVIGYSLNITASDVAIVRGLSTTFPDEPQIRFKTNVALKNPKLVANFNGDSAI